MNDGEAQSGTARIAIAPVVDSVESLEHTLALLLGNPRTFVVDDEVMFVLSGFSGYPDAATFAALTSRAVSGEPSPSDNAAPYTSGRASSTAMCTSASLCLIAWYEPIARPNWWRCLA